MERVINKLGDTQDFHGIAYRCVFDKLVLVKQMLDQTQLPWSSHMTDHWLRWWEYTWAIVESGVKTDMKVLDAGGTGTMFAYTLAKLGCVVVTIDLSKEKLADAEVMTNKLNIPNIKNLYGNILNIDYPDCTFDCVFSICVIEHITPVENQTKAILELGRVLKPGGRMALTFDFEVSAAFREGGPQHVPDALTRWEDVFNRIITPARMEGLEVLGECDYVSWHPQDRTRNDNIKLNYGSILLQKAGKLNLPYKPFFNIS